MKIRIDWNDTPYFQQKQTCGRCEGTGKVSNGTLANLAIKDALGRVIVNAILFKLALMFGLADAMIHLIETFR